VGGAGPSRQNLLWAWFKVLRRLRQLAGPLADQSAGKPRTHLLSDQA
jgi:hypothetical protein